jgi:hypothetical protein
VHARPGHPASNIDSRQPLWIQDFVRVDIDAKLKKEAGSELLKKMGQDHFAVEGCKKLPYLQAF